MEEVNLARLQYLNSGKVTGLGVAHDFLSRQYVFRSVEARWTRA